MVRYEYAVLRVIPDVRRGECVNVGLVVFKESGVDVRMLPSLAKVLAINGGMDLNQLRDLPPTVDKWLSGIDGVAAQHAALKDLGVVTVSSLGHFEISAKSEYELMINRLMKSLVVPVPAQRKVLSANTRITTALKEKFRKNGILGSKLNDIAKHLVVPNYPIAEADGLFADFVVKNGAYHVTETTDLRAASNSNIERVRLASFTAIKLHKARENFGNKTRRFVVYASRGRESAQAEHLIGDFSDAIFHLENKAEMVSYMERIMEAASATHAMPLIGRGRQ